MVIMKGAATVYHNGTEVRRFGSLDVLGEGALVEGDHTRGATVTANTPIQALVLSYERYQELLLDGTIEEKTQEMAAKYRAGNYGYGHAKQELFELICDNFSEQRKKFNYLMSNTDIIELELKKGAKKASEIAIKVLARIRNNIGY